MSGHGHAAALDKAEQRRRGLFKTYTDLRRDAQDSEDYEQHQFVAEAYRAFMRSFLDSDERAVLDLQDEVARLQAELSQWRRGIKRAES